MSAAHISSAFFVARVLELFWLVTFYLKWSVWEHSTIQYNVLSSSNAEPAIQQRKAFSTGEHLQYAWANIKCTLVDAYSESDMTHEHSRELRKMPEGQIAVRVVPSSLGMLDRHAAMRDAQQGKTTIVASMGKGEVQRKYNAGNRCLCEKPLQKVFA